MRIWLFPFSTLLGIAALFAFTISTFFIDGLQYTVPAFATFLLLISLAYFSVHEKRQLEVNPSAAP